MRVQHSSSLSSVRKGNNAQKTVTDDSRIAGIKNRRRADGNCAALEKHVLEPSADDSADFSARKLMLDETLVG